MHILFLAPRVPWPLDTGGKIRTYHMLKGLARVHHVTVLAFWDTEVERQGAGALAGLGAEIEIVPRSTELRARVLDAALGASSIGPYCAMWRWSQWTRSMRCRSCTSRMRARMAARSYLRIV